MLQQPLGLGLRVEAERLGQVAQGLPHLALLPEHVEVAEVDRPRVRLLQCRDDPHQGRLPGAVPAEESEHSLRHVERDVLQCLGAVRVGLREVTDDEMHGRTPVQG